MNTKGNLNSAWYDSSKQPKTEPARFAPRMVDTTGQYTVSERISLTLKNARLNWTQAKAVIRLANQGQVNKSVAFSLMNKARREYKQAIRMAEAFLQDGS